MTKMKVAQIAKAGARRDDRRVATTA